MKKNKAVFILLAILIIMATILAIVFIMKTKSLKPQEGEIGFYVTQKGTSEGYYAYSSIEKVYRPIEVSADQKTSLTILNGTEDVESIYVIITDSQGKIFSREQFFENQKTYTLDLTSDTSEVYDVSFVLIRKEAKEFYVANENCFLDITADSRVKDQSVILLRDLHINKEANNKITFSYPFRWNLGSCAFETDLAICFDSENVGTMYIDNQNASSLTTGCITCNTPEWELIWNGENAPSFDYVEQYMNVKAYNGQITDEFIGGKASDILLSGSIKLSTETPNEFVIDGNYIHIYYRYTDSIALEDAQIAYELIEDGTAEIVKNKDTYYFVITNSKGENRGYKINLIQKDYNLPVIYIETENHQAVTSKEEKLKGTFSLDYNETEGYANIESQEMVIRGRGHSSWKLDKKPYKIKFEDKVSLFGLTSAKEWVLQANHVDKSLIRNKLAMDMGAVLDHVLFVPHSYNVDVFVNGTYMGVYTLTEQIEVKDGRIPGEKDSTQVDTDYLVELGGDEEATSFGTNMFHSPLYNWIEIKNPDTDILSKEQFDFIKDYMYRADTAVMQLEGYEEYIDIPSLIDFFLLTEFSYNVDGAFRRSDFIMKKSGNKLYMATYWDFDYAFGNFWRDSADFDEWICLGNENTQNYITDSWITYLLSDPAFTTQLKARWNEVGEELYHTAMSTIDEAEKNVSASAEENFIRWPGVLGYKTQYQFYKTAEIATYEGQLQYLRDYIQKRYEWMDKTIGDM